MTEHIVNRAVRRALARDDLIGVAVDADRAIGIVRQREALPRRTESEQDLFSLALDHHLRVAGNPGEGWATRSQAARHAAVILRFGQMVGIPARLPDGRRDTPVELLAWSIAMLFDPSSDSDEPRDLTLHTFHRYRLARELRLCAEETGDDDLFRHALGSAQVAPEQLYGSGAEGYTARLAYEACVSHIRTGRAAEVESLLEPLEKYYRDTRARGHSTRYRVDLVRALARWELSGAGPADPRVDCALAATLEMARTHQKEASGRGIGLLSVLLTRAEYLAGDRAEALDLGREVLEIAEEARGRWRVIARSRAPLAVVFQRLYGDLALLAADLTGPDAAVLGLRVALSAKQTGFAALIRSGQGEITPEVERIIDEIIDEEDEPRTTLVGGRSSRRKLEHLRFELREAVSPMLADIVLPPAADLGRLITMIGDRYAVDYLELPDTLADAPNQFRSLIRPGGRITFERFDPDSYYVDLFARARGRENLAYLLRLALATGPTDLREVEAETPVDQDDQRLAAAGRFSWAGLARELLPAELLVELATPAAASPELVISAHSWLSLVPWPALRIGAGGPRLIERAIVTQTPAFTCLYHPRQPDVTGAALVRLVGRDEEGVDVSAERGAWGLEPVNAGVPLSGCALVSADPPVPLAESLSEALRDAGRWGFVHLAAHGGGEGLAQRLSIPEESLSFGKVLRLNWSESVLMASCHVGRVLNVAESEPLNLVMGMLSRGARCVVAGITSIDDRGTGRVAKEIVTAIRSGPLPLDLALHQAQLSAVTKDRPEHEWALLGAYVQ